MSPDGLQMAMKAFEGVASNGFMDELFSEKEMVCRISIHDNTFQLPSSQLYTLEQLPFCALQEAARLQALHNIDDYDKIIPGKLYTH